MASINIIIDTESDTDFYTEVRNLIGVEALDLPNDIIKSDIMLGMAEREICKVHVPNWQDVLNGDDSFAARALRSAVVLKLCLNILNAPAIQNLFINEFRLVDIIMNTNVNVDKLKLSLNDLFLSQLSIVGVERTDAWPVQTIIGKTDNITVYDFYVDTDGVIRE